MSLTPLYFLYERLEIVRWKEIRNKSELGYLAVHSGHSTNLFKYYGREIVEDFCKHKVILLCVKSLLIIQLRGEEPENR